MCHLSLEVASASSDLVVWLLIFWASLSGAPAFISLRIFGGGAVVGIGARGVCSGAATSFAVFLKFWFSCSCVFLGEPLCLSTVQSPSILGERERVPLRRQRL
jgi:hypothetical protein